MLLYKQVFGVFSSISYLVAPSLAEILHLWINNGEVYGTEWLRSEARTVRDFQAKSFACWFNCSLYDICVIL